MSFYMDYFGVSQLTLLELKLLLWISDNIHQSYNLPHHYRVNLKDFAEKSCLKMIKYSEWKAALSQLSSRLITLQTTNLSFDKPMFERIDLTSRSTEITIVIHPSVAVLFFRIVKIVNRSEINLLLQAKSQYTIILYIWIKNSLWPGQPNSLSELREIFGVTDKYPRIANLRARVLDPSITELEEHFGLQINFEVLGKQEEASIMFEVGRKISHLNLDINHDLFYEQARTFSLDAGLKLTLPLYEKWLNYGEYAIILAIDYVHRRPYIKNQIPYINKMLQSGNFGAPLNGLTKNEYLVISEYLELYRGSSALTPTFMIQEKFFELCCMDMSEIASKRFWTFAKEKIEKDIFSYIKKNRSKK